MENFCKFSIWLIVLLLTQIDKKMSILVIEKTKIKIKNENSTVHAPTVPNIKQILEKQNYTGLNSVFGNTYDYLVKYGYLDDAKQSKPYHSKGNNMTAKLGLIKSAIGKFQRFNRIPVTEKLDQETLNKMHEGRCGNADMGDTIKRQRKLAKKRIKRYTVAGSRWKNKILDYCISIYSIQAYRSGTMGLVDREIERAISEWNKHLPFKIVRSECTRNGKQFRWAKLDMRFAKGKHGDGDPFDGPGKVLAHAFYPTFGGDVHFDDDETWDFDGNHYGVNLFTVALHEIGHSLGLEHSDKPGSIMAPVYPKYYPGLTVGNDDIEGINYIYSLKLKPKPTTNTKINPLTPKVAYAQH